MCGRFTLRPPSEQLGELFRLSALPPITARPSSVPTDQVTAVRVSPGSQEREWALLRWGLIPAWSKDPHGTPPHQRPLRDSGCCDHIPPRRWLPIRCGRLR